MSIASILGPPRNGRVVRDAQEVIRELEEQARVPSLEAEVVRTQKPDGEEPDFYDQPNTRHLLKFHVGQMISNPDYFELRDLEIPEGRWQSLKLVTCPAYGGSVKGPWDYWDSDSQSDLAKSFSSVDGIVEHGVWCSLRVLYWFMRAGYELRGVHRDATEKFRNFIIDSMNPDRWQFSELFTPELNLVHQKTGGLPIFHNLYYSISFEKSYQDANGQLLSEVSPESYCLRLLGDRLESVSEVLRWYSDLAARCKSSILASPDIAHPYCAELSLLGNTSTLAFNANPSISRPAYFVIANPQEFAPLGGKP